MKIAFRRPLVFSVVLVFILFSFIVPEQRDKLLQNILDKLTIYSDLEAPEKTYLHTDKDFYSNGDTIWFKTYLVDGVSHRPSTKSKVVYVELVDEKDKVVAQRKLYVNELGAWADIQIAPDMEAGDYFLRSYTKYMLNEKEPVVFEKKVPIWFQSVNPNQTSVLVEKGIRWDENIQDPEERSVSEIQRPKVRFFPEAGDLVNGLTSIMGLEVTAANGEGLALKGSIKEANGTVVSDFQSADFGLGMINFRPKRNKQYFASIDLEGTEYRFNLPEPLEKGYVLSIKNRGEHVLVQLASTMETGLEGTVLIGHLRGKTILQRMGKKSDQGSYAIKLPTTDLADGVAHFTLFGPDGDPVGERLVFIDNPKNEVAMHFKTDADGYGPREKVSLDLSVIGSDGFPMEGDFSMGIVRENTGSAFNDRGMDIKSWLLLDSDLGATVQDPGFFFAEDSADRKALLDALMLTHGWRRFVWKDILDKKADKPLEHLPEKGIMISGRTTALYDKRQTKNTLTTLSILKPRLFDEKRPTDGQGRFEFGPFLFTDSINAIVQSVDTTKKRIRRQKSIAIYLDDPWPYIPETTVGRKKQEHRPLPSTKSTGSRSVPKKRPILSTVITLPG